MLLLVGEQSSGLVIFMVFGVTVLCSVDIVSRELFSESVTVVWSMPC